MNENKTVKHYVDMAREAVRSDPGTFSNPASMMTCPVTPENVHVFQMYEPTPGHRECACGATMEVVR